MNNPLKAKPLPAGRYTLKEAPGLLYQHVAALIRKRIEQGEWVAGERLPAIPKLAESYGTAIVTIRQALAELEQDGLVDRQQGRGTFVCESPTPRRWLKLESSWDTLIKLWGQSTPRPLKVHDSIGTTLLDPDEGIAAPAYRYMRRVHYSDNLPYTIVDIYLDRRLYALCPERFDTESVIFVLDSLPEVEIRSMRQCLTIGTADLEVAELLDIAPNAPVGIVRRVVRDQNDVAIYVGEATYRGDLVKLEREMVRTR